MATTFVLIDKAILTGSQASIEFTSIPSTYTDLILKVSARGDNSADYCVLHINGSTSNFTQKNVWGNGSSVGSQSRSDSALVGVIAGNGTTANTFSNAEFYIPNYTSSNYKSISCDPVDENNGTNANAYPVAILWSNTAAITSIKVAHPNSNLVSGTSAYLYGIKNS